MYMQFVRCLGEVEYEELVRELVTLLRTDRSVLSDICLDLLCGSRDLPGD